MGKTYRMYCNAEGKSTWEEVDWATYDGWAKGIDVTQLRFGTRAPGQMQDWHPAPQRQFVIILSGQLEIGFEDGSTRVFGPGDGPGIGTRSGFGWRPARIALEPISFMGAIGRPVKHSTVRPMT